MNEAETRAELIDAGLRTEPGHARLETHNKCLYIK